MSNSNFSGSGYRLLVGAVVVLVLLVVVQAVLFVFVALDDSDGPDGSAAPSDTGLSFPPISVPSPEAGADQSAQGAPEPAVVAPVDSGDGREHYVVYTADGEFSPERLEAGVGDTVVFVNASPVDFWPASNIHPTHEILPEFDALGPVASGRAWKFVFDEAGQWQYHDHLNPAAGGVVVATQATGAEGQGGEADTEADTARPPADGGSAQGSDEGPQGSAAPLEIEMPAVEFAALPDDAVARYSGIYTDDAELKGFMERFGPSNTFSVLKQIELDTNGDCHQRAHEAGRISYDMFGPASFALASHECQSGGFHGATEALFASRGTANLADDVAALCSDAPNPFIRHQCLHGIGHGIMAWSNYELHQSLGLCDSVAGRSDQQSCYSGVFMENVVGGLSGAMGHTTEYLRLDDPVYPCDVVDPQHRADCYFYQTTHMLAVFNQDLAAVARQCAQAPADSVLHCFNSYGRDAASVGRNDPATVIGYCSYATTVDHNVACTQGSVQNGFWEKPGGPRAAQYCKLLDSDPQSHPASREACYETIITRARDVFSTDQEYEQFCALLPEERRSQCRLALSL